MPRSHKFIPEPLKCSASKLPKKYWLSKHKAGLTCISQSCLFPHVKLSKSAKNGGSPPRNVRFCSGLHDAGHKGVATRRCEFSLCSPTLVEKTTPLNEVSLYISIAPVWEVTIFKGLMPACSHALVSFSAFSRDGRKAIPQSPPPAPDGFPAPP